MLGLWQDLRRAARSLAKAPGFTSVAIVVLGVGITVTSIVFGLVDSVLIRPLPFAEPGRLVMLWEHAPTRAHNRVTPLNFSDWSDQNHAFASIAAISGAGWTMAGSDGAAQRVPGQAV